MDGGAIVGGASDPVLGSSKKDDYHHDNYSFDIY